jgi:hypothetical protein
MFDAIRSISAPSIPRPTGFGEWVRDHDERWSFVVLYLGLAVGLSVFVSLFWLLVVGAVHFALECGRQAHYRNGRVEVIGHALWEVKLDIGLILLALTLVLYIEVVLGLLGIQSAARAAAATRAGARLGTRAAAWERNIRTFLLTVDEMARIAYAAWLVRKGGSGAHRVTGPQGATGAGIEGAAAAGAPIAGAEAATAGEEEGAAEAAAAARTEAAAEAAAVARTEAAVEAAAVARSEAAAEAAAEARAEAEAEAAGPVAPGDGWRGPWGVGDRIGVALVVSSLVLLLAAPFLTIHDWGSAIATILAELQPFPS